MNKVYKNAEEFLMENFPKSYPEYKKDMETSLEHYIKTSAEQFKKELNDILHGELQTTNTKKAVQNPI
jgi:hypothetical protein